MRLGYLPLVSTFCFSSSFIFWIVGSWLAWPVVWVVLAGGLALGTEVWSGSDFAGRVAVALGGELVWAWAAAPGFKRTTLDSSDTVSAVSLGLLYLMFIDLLLSDR
jgi:hypothetical protein